MIPPSLSAPVPAPQPPPQQPVLSPQQQIQQAYAPQWVQPGSQPPPQVDPDVARKIEIAQGRGLRVNPNLVQATHGEQIMLQFDSGVPMPCKYCQATPCYGIRWIFDDEVRFKCGTCGKSQKLGYTGQYAAQNQANLQGWDRAESNRRALWRDQDAQAQEQMRNEFSEYARDPNSHLSAMRNPQFVQSEFLS